MLSTELPGPDCDTLPGTCTYLYYRRLSGEHKVYGGGTSLTSVTYNSMPTKLRIVRDQSETDDLLYAFVDGAWVYFRTFGSGYKKYLTLYGWCKTANGDTVCKVDNLKFKYGCPSVSPTAWTTTSTSTLTSTTTTEPPV